MNEAKPSIERAANIPCGSLGQLTLRDGSVTVGCGLEKGHDDPQDRPPHGIYGSTPHRFWVEWPSGQGDPDA